MFTTGGGHPTSLSLMARFGILACPAKRGFKSDCHPERWWAERGRAPVSADRLTRLTTQYRAFPFCIASRGTLCPELAPPQFGCTCMPPAHEVFRAARFHRGNRQAALSHGILTWMRYPRRDWESHLAEPAPYQCGFRPWGFRADICTVEGDAAVNPDALHCVIGVGRT